MKIGNKLFEDNRTHIMGILNVTPDSFSDGGKFSEISAALKHAEEMIKDGAVIIDIGGESTRHGYTKISDEEEIDRVAPIIEAVKLNFDIPVSIDTYKSKVAEAAIKSGADMVNDIWGLKYDADMANVVSRNNSAVCIMHNRKEAVYSDFLNDVKNDLTESIAIAKNHGISDEKIVLDPGVGFAKSLEQNLLITNKLETLSDLGYPILLGTSRKSMIGLTLDLPVTERVEGTLATTVLACIKGALFVRVHDIKENYRIIKMTEAIINS